MQQKRGNETTLKRKRVDSTAMQRKRVVREASHRMSLRAHTRNMDRIQALPTEVMMNILARLNLRDKL